MYIYIYDNFVNQKKYDSVLAKIETRITDLGLNGKIVRLGIMSSFSDTIRNEVKKGAKTLVVVGNDKTLNNAVNILAKISAENNLNISLPLGFIPIGKKDNLIAPFLGLDFEENACDMLSARRIERLDLGLANNNHFLTSAVISTAGTIIEIDKTYSIEISESGEINIINLPTAEDISEKLNINAKDNSLDLYIKTKPSGKIFSAFKNNCEQSLFSFQKIKISNSKTPMNIDYSTEISCPVQIELAKEKIDLIVGKNRSF